MTSIPTSLRCCLMVWVATSPMCATNFSFRLFAWVQPSHGHRFFATYSPLEMERPVHGHGGLESQGNRCVTVQSCQPAGEKGCVALDLDQLEAGGGIDHLLQQPRGVDLGVREAHPVGSHVVGVAADVSDEEERTT